MNWISVKDKLPEDGERVLAYGIHYCLDDEDYAHYELDANSQDATLELCCFSINEEYAWWIYNVHCCVEGLQNVTHWMPIPKEPKGE